MSIFKKLVANLFPTQHKSETPAHYVYVRCKRCNEVIKGRINFLTELNKLDDGTYMTRKVLIGNKRCFEQIEIILYFDKKRTVMDQQIHNGFFISEDEYKNN